MKQLYKIKQFWDNPEAQYERLSAKYSRYDLLKNALNYKAGRDGLAPIKERIKKESADYTEEEIIISNKLISTLETLYKQVDLIESTSKNNQILNLNEFIATIMSDNQVKSQVVPKDSVSLQVFDTRVPLNYVSPKVLLSQGFLTDSYEMNNGKLNGYLVDPQDKDYRILESQESLMGFLRGHTFTNRTFLDKVFTYCMYMLLVKNETPEAVFINSSLWEISPQGVSFGSMKIEVEKIDIQEFALKDQNKNTVNVNLTLLVGKHCGKNKEHTCVFIGG